MAGVILRSITNVLTVPNKTTIQTLYKLTAAANHGIVIYRVQVEMNPNGRSASKVAQITLRKPTVAGSGSTANHPQKLYDDVEDVQTDGQELMTNEPLEGIVVDAKQVSIGGSGITTSIFNYSRGLKIDGSEMFTVAITEDEDPGDGAHAKCRVIIDLEE
jgi:hypothetical protein